MAPPNPAHTPLPPQAFTKLLGLKLSRTEDLDPETLKSPPYTAYTVPFSSLRVQKLRPYFFNRTFTDTDVGYGVSDASRGPLLVVDMAGFCGTVV